MATSSIEPPVSTDASATQVTGVKPIKTIRNEPGHVTWERAEGYVHVERVGDKNRVSLEPFNRSQHIGVIAHETSYPLDLIESIVRAKEFGYICDEMCRDEATDYVLRGLRQAILAFCPAEAFAGKRLLDFGCGMGASTMLLSRLFPQTRIVGVELEPYLIDIARKRQSFYGAANVELLQSPGGDSLPPNLGQFDYVVFSALFEHLLPHERKTILPLVWRLLRPDGVLFISETPHRWHFREGHTTRLMFLNYLPDRMALWATRRFCPRYPKDVTWEFLLREGIRGGTEREILGILRGEAGQPKVLQPLDGSDAIDCWFETTNKSRLKRGMKRSFKVLKALTGIAYAPAVQVAIRRMGIAA